jgi:5-methylcytosine-specific restriction protein B
MIQKVNPPVSWEELKKTKELGECEVFRNNQGSLFRMKQDEYEIIMDMIAFKMESPSARVLAYDFDTDPDKPFIEATEFKELCQLLLKKKNIILQGAAGVGKTFLAKKMAYQILKEQNDAVIEMVQFHQSYSYEDFVQGLRPDTSGNFVLTNGVFYSFCKKAAHQPTLPFFFIIDEINRGNLSKILGELMLLIEHDKRKSAYALKLTYAENDQDKFYVPENVHIIGTMNTADRSLAMIDYALRRRFAFADITPCFDANFSDFLNKNNISEEVSTHIVDCIQKVNQYIANDDALGKGFLIGHSYFTNFDENKTNWEWWSDIIRYELKPLFEEIWFDSPQKITEMLSILAPKKQ